MPDIQKVDALIEIVTKLATVVRSSQDRHGSFAERDIVDGVLADLRGLKEGK
jgi:hypothetical protein